MRSGKIHVLFDMDGVLLDTEKHYTAFWDDIGRRFLYENGLGVRVKGKSLKGVFSEYFAGRDAEQERIEALLDDFECSMTYEYVPGVEQLLRQLRAEHIPTAVVTSSNHKKMANVYRARPEFRGYFDIIVTSEMFNRSKPAPDCFLMGMKLLDASPRHTVVFEDSVHGLQAAREAGCTVVGVATTFPREEVRQRADYVIDNFEGIDTDWLRGLF